MTRGKRRDIYWQAYFIMEAKEHSFKGSDFLCHCLQVICDKDITNFPELMKQKPRKANYAWWDIDGFGKRQKALLNAIELTYEN